MTKYFGLVVILASLCGWAADQKPPAAEQPAGSLSGYTAMSVDAGYVSSSLTGKFESMKDGVRITLLSNDPAKKPIPITSNEVHFVWPEKGTGKQPSRILFEGKVVIEHPDGTVRAEKADWDFEKGLLTFTGSPTVDSPQLQGLRGEKVVLNFKEGRFEMFGGTIKNYPLAGMGAAPESPGPATQLNVNDITDWPGFLAALKEQANGEKPSPGKRLFALVDGNAQKTLAAMPPNPTPQDKDNAIKMLNRVLVNPKLYTEDMWNGIKLPQAATSLLGKSTRSVHEQMLLNRQLLEAAFPGMIASSETP
jgi:hypothetical protein